MKTDVELLWKDKKHILGMPISFTRYSMSEDRVFLQKGVFSVQFEEIVLYRVTDISLKMSLGQRMCGLGTIIVHSSDKTTPHFEIRSIRHPLQVKEMLYQQVEKMKLARRIRINELLSGDEDCIDCDDDDL
ncbi:MAG: PH domain-containing protein [Oscillospiraceae bacterium]|nr:PH domain-containing protein [Oscillospiraceae bacterium]